jgi:urease accessory protein
LSGLGHPVVGIDHLAFLIALGFAAAMIRSGLALVAGVVLCSLPGVLLKVSGLSPPHIEVLVAASLILTGAWFLSPYLTSGTWAAPALLLFGVAHGFAFGEAVVGAEPTPVGAYLVGLGIVQTIIIAAVAFGIRALSARSASFPAKRAAVPTGAVLLAVGLIQITTA